MKGNELHRFFHSDVIPVAANFHIPLRVGRRRSLYRIRLEIKWQHVIKCMGVKIYEFYIKHITRAKSAPSNIDLLHKNS